MFKILSICKGGGYKYCRTNPKHPKANTKGLYPLHRVVMENKLGRLLVKGEDVHHKDEDKNNNEPYNLEVLTKAEHTKRHKKPLLLIDCVCPVCGKCFVEKPHIFRLRTKRNKGGVLFCSLHCSGVYYK